MSRADELRERLGEIDEKILGLATGLEQVAEKAKAYAEENGYPELVADAERARLEAERVKAVVAEWRS